MQWTSVIGFHATWKSVADAICNGHDRFRAGSNGWDWLGTGVYFWIENKKMAHMWKNKIAKEDTERSINDKPVIVECDIKLGECLNLADSDHISRIEKYLNIAAGAGITFSANNKLGAHGSHLNSEPLYRHLDHEIIDSYCDDISDYIVIDSVFGVFNSGSPIYSGSSIMKYSTMQLSVRPCAVENITVINVY